MNLSMNYKMVVVCSEKKIYILKKLHNTVFVNNSYYSQCKEKQILQRY